MKFTKGISLLGCLVALSGCQFLESPVTGTGGGIGTGTVSRPSVLSCDSQGSVSQVVQAGPDEEGGTVYAHNVPADRDITLSIPAYQDTAGSARIIVQACKQVGGQCAAEGPMGTTYRVCRNPQIITRITGPWMCNPSSTNNCQ